MTSMTRLLGTLLLTLLAVSGAGCGSDERGEFEVRPHGATPGGVKPRAAVHASSFAGVPGAVFGAQGAGVAFATQVNGKVQVVHNGRAGRSYDEVSIPALSRDGRRIAYGALLDGKWRMVVDGVEGAAFTGVNSPVFSPNGKHVAYLAQADRTWHLVMDGSVSRGASSPFVEPAFNATSSRIAFIDGADDAGWGRLVVSDLSLARQTVVADRAAKLVVAPGGKRFAAVSASAGRRRVVVVDFDRPELARKEPDQDDVGPVAFGPGGESLAYVAERSGKRFVVLDGREEPLAPGEEPVAPPEIRPGGGVGIFILSAGRVGLRQFFAEGDGGDAGYDAAEGLVYSRDGRSYAYVALKGEKWVLVVNGKEGLPVDRAISPMFSNDGRFVVYRAREAGRRFVVLADGAGRTISLHRGYEQVYPVWFSADGKSIAYGVMEDGKYAWKSERL